VPITFNTGTATSNGGSTVTSWAVTIPAGVLANDVVLVVFSAFRGTAAETIQVSSTGTAPAIIGSTQSVTFGSDDVKSALFYFVASATDAGKVITGSFVSGDVANWAVALAAYTGALTSGPIDVSGAATSSGASSTITCPSEVTNVANDRDIQIVGAALGGSAYTGGTGFTQRESVSDPSSGSTAFIYDSNASVGPARLSGAVQLPDAVKVCENVRRIRPPPPMGQRRTTRPVARKMVLV
jgi:hypothetical protein